MPKDFIEFCEKIFGYEKKDIKIDLGTKPEIKEDIDPKNGYIVIKIVK